MPSRPQPLSDIAVPAPIVDWETIVRALYPSAEPSRARFRTARDAHRTSDGVRVAKRLNGRLNGSDSFHSVLAVLATFADRSGDRRSAKGLITGANRIEKRYSERLKLFLAEGDWDDLPQSDFYRQLWTDTRKCIAENTRLTSTLTHGVVRWVDGSHARIEPVAPGSDGPVDLPRQALDAWGLAAGDWAVVFRDIHDWNILISVMPAAAEPDLNEEGVSTEVSAFERKRVAAIASELSREDLDALRRIVQTETIGTRILRPAG